MDGEGFQALIRRLAPMNGYVIRLAPGSGDLLATSMKPHQLGFIPMMTVERVRIVGLDRALKSVLDIGTALLGVLLGAPLMLLAFVALRVRGVRLFCSVR